MTFCDLEPLFHIKLKCLQSLSCRLPLVAIKVWFWCISDVAFFFEKDIISSCKSVFSQLHSLFLGNSFKVLKFACFQLLSLWFISPSLTAQAYASFLLPSSGIQHKMCAFWLCRSFEDGVAYSLGPHQQSPFPPSCNACRVHSACSVSVLADPPCLYK